MLGNKEQRTNLVESQSQDLWHKLKFYEHVELHIYSLIEKKLRTRLRTQSLGQNLLVYFCFLTKMFVILRYSH